MEKGTPNQGRKIKRWCFAVEDVWYNERIYRYGVAAMLRSLKLAFESLLLRHRAARYNERIYRYGVAAKKHSLNHALASLHDIMNAEPNNTGKDF